MALRTEVVDFVWTEVVEEGSERTAVGEVGIVEKQARTRLVGVLIEVIQPVCVQAGGTALEAVDFVAPGKEELGQVGPVLAGATGDQSFGHR